MSINMNKKSIMALVLTVVFILSTATAYAGGFSDVPSSHWAKPYVDKMSDAGIIEGNNGEFNPNGDVSHIQAVALVSRLVGYSDSQKRDSRSKYESFFNDIDVESWYRNDVAVALEENIVTKEFVEGLYEENIQDNSEKRYRVAVYLTRAMGLESEAKSKVIIDLPFNDWDLMPIDVRAYVEVMVDEEVISEKGDSEGNFNPNDAVSRAEMAKMLDVAYSYIQDNDLSYSGGGDSDTDTGDNGIDFDDVKKVEGTIQRIIKGTETGYVSMEDEDDEMISFEINTNTDIELDDENIDMSELIEGLKVEVQMEDNKALTIVAESKEEEYKGKINDLRLSLPARLEILYEVEDDDGDIEEEEKSFPIHEDVKVVLDNEKSNIRDLEEGDKIEILVRNNKIVEIDAEEKDKTIEGNIEELKYDPEPVLVIRDEDDELHEYPVDEDADIERNNHDVELTDLMIGDEVEVDIEYNVIIDVEAEIVESEEEGIIEEIIIASKPKLTIRTKDDDKLTYYVSKNADIEVSNKLAKIYDLRLGYFVDLELQSNEIVTLEAEERQKNDRYSGIIKYINDDAGVITISIQNSDGEDELFRVDITDDTKVIDIDGDSSRLRYLDEGDEILVIGTYDGGIFTSKTIMVTEDMN